VCVCVCCQQEEERLTAGEITTKGKYCVVAREPVSQRTCQELKKGLRHSKMIGSQHQDYSDFVQHTSIREDEYVILLCSSKLF
jgi:hypothetical protein